MPLLPTDAAERKKLPIGTGVLDYFPDALAEVAKASVAGNKQHLNGQPLHWDRSKSTDESDALIRHFLERDKMDEDGILHAGKMAWRALSYTQKLIEKRRAGEAIPVDRGFLLTCQCSIKDPTMQNPECPVHGEK